MYTKTLRTSTQILWCCGCGIVAVLACLVMTSVDKAQPLASAALMPGVFIVAKVLGAPCAASHTVECRFWDIDVQILNPHPALLVTALLVDGLLYGCVLMFVWRVMPKRLVPT